MNLRALATTAILTFVCVVFGSLGASAAEILEYQSSIFDDSVDPMDGLPSMSSGTSIAVSPDGENLYIVSQDDWALSVFDRDLGTGAVSNQTVITNSPAISNGLARPSTVIVSEDGKHVYVSPTSGAFAGVTVFQRDLVTGALTYLEVERGVTLGGDSRLVVSPDGQHLYATARADVVAVFARDVTTGALTYLQSFVDGAGGVNGLDQALDLAISPDGTHLYVVAFADSALTVFERDTLTGLLTFQSEHFDNTPGYAFLQGAASVRVGPDGNEVYVSSFYEAGLNVYDRDPTTGALTFRNNAPDGGTGGAQWLSLSADGGRLYSAVWVAALDVFARNPVTGDITFLERKLDGTGGVDGIDGIQGMTVSPDGQDVYTGSFYDKALSLFSVACGNGVTEVGEDCDDLNPFGADCCSETCTLPTGCLLPLKAQLQIRHGADPTKDRLKWKWSKGEAFTQVEVGAPTTDTDYRLCVYDHSTGVTRLAAELVVPAGANWTDLDPKGAKYVDKLGGANGVQQVQLKTGAAERTKAQVKASGVSLAPMLSAFSGSEFFDQDPSVSALLVNGEGTCWSSEFLPAGTKQNELEAFKAKTP